MGDYIAAWAHEQMVRILIGVVGAAAIVFMLGAIVGVGAGEKQRDAEVSSVLVGASSCGDVYFFVLAYGNGRTRVYEYPEPPPEVALERLRAGTVTVVRQPCAKQQRIINDHHFEADSGKYDISGASRAGRSPA